MAKQKWIFSLMAVIAALWIAVIAGAKWIQHGLNRDHPAPAVPRDLAESDELKTFWPVPAFSFPDQDNQRVTNQSLRGHVWVADFIFTQCTSACPIITSKLMLLQKRVTLPAVRFISFSVDPEHDTPTALKTYADLWQGDQLRWRLLSTDTAGLSNLTAGMKVTVAPSGDRDNPILHTNLMFLVDATGEVRGIYDSGDEEAMARLEEDLRLLAGNAPDTVTVDAGGPDGVERGRSLFGSMGCLACHTRPAIAPPLQSLYGSLVRLDDRRMVWADEAYLHESIVDPAAKVVAGYTKSMPNYQNYLSDAQVMDLVAYIKSLSNNQPGGHGFATASTTTQPAVAELLIDPVCGMQVSKDSTAPHAEFNGKTYYVCADRCREQFLRRPAAFAATTEPAR